MNHLISVVDAVGPFTIMVLTVLLLLVVTPEITLFTHFREENPVL